MSKQQTSALYQAYQKRVTKNPAIDAMSYGAFECFSYHERLRLAGVFLVLRPDAKEFLSCAPLKSYALGVPIPMQRLPMAMKIDSESVDIFLQGEDGEWYVLYPFEYTFILPDAAKEIPSPSPGS